jgi:hypothetical protein
MSPELGLSPELGDRSAEHVRPLAFTPSGSWSALPGARSQSTEHTLAWVVGNAREKRVRITPMDEREAAFGKRDEITRDDA